jgi:hypothetical protein
MIELEDILHLRSVSVEPFAHVRISLTTSLIGINATNFGTANPSYAPG